MSKPAGSTVIKPCTCKSSYQDSLYGPNQRVHNCGKEPTGKVSGTQTISCMVCGSKKEI